MTQIQQITYDYENYTAPSGSSASSELESFLHQHPLFSSFSSVEFETLERHLVCVEFSAGETIFKQGMQVNTLYLLLQGSVEILKIEGNKTHKLADVSARDIFGEMSFLDQEDTSAAVRATSDVKAYLLRRADLERIDPFRGREIRHKLCDQISKTVIRRLRASQTETIQHIDSKHRFGNFFILLILSACITILVTGSIQSANEHLPLQIITSLGFSSGIIICYFMIKSLGQPLVFYGLSRSGWQKSLIEGIGISLLLIAFFSVFWPEIDLLGTISSLFEGYRGPLYIGMAFLQEYIYRGVLQSTLRKYYADHYGYMAIPIAALFSSVNHIHYGLDLTLMTFIAFLFLGWVFFRHNNLVGVSIIHFVLGCMAVSLGLLEIPG